MIRERSHGGSNTRLTVQDLISSIVITASRTHTFFGQHNDVIQLDAAALGEKHSRACLGAQYDEVMAAIRRHRRHAEEYD